MEFDFSIVYDSDTEEFDGLDMYYGSKETLKKTSKSGEIRQSQTLNG